MCSSSWQMDNDHGDLSDILRVSSRGGGSIIGGSSATSSGYDWNFPPEPTDVQASCPDHDRMDDLSSIFHSVHDPFFQETDQMVKSVFYPASNPLFLSSTNYPDHIYGDAMMSHEMNPLLSRMIQIGPKTKLRVPDNSSSSSSSVSPGIINPMNEVVKGTNSLDRTDEKSGVQTNSSRNPASKKRKNQIKKVVCVPAPAALSGKRPTGEVVPSDLWAWRKYGQKPIKGSPYPRGYYRCSSSKGCSARKQVERSRNDPNMLVITYTSEHNHPWPTQRNALAGSTRSQPTKTATTTKVSPPPPHTTAKVDEAMSEELIKDNSTNHTHKGHEESIKDEIGMETEVVCVKKEVIGDVNKNLGMHGDDMNQDYHRSYRPFHIENQSDDFFYELDELEPNPLKLLFPNGLDCEKSNDDPAENKGLDSFGLFEWPENSTTGSRKGL